MRFVHSQYKGNHRGGRQKAAPPSVELLGVTLCRLGGARGPSWGDVGVIWGRLGVPLEPLGLPWGAFGSSCRCRESVWAALGGHAAETQCLCTKYGLLELIRGIGGIHGIGRIPGIPGSGVKKCCSGLSFHARPLLRMTGV